MKTIRIEANRGAKYGRLTLLVEVGRGARGARRCLFQCLCGSIKVVDFRLARLGKTRSCGCLRNRRLTKGSKKFPEYSAYVNMIRRCDPKRGKIEYYGRGIAVCDRWKNGTENKAGFFCFIEDMGRRPKGKKSNGYPKFELDRKDNSKGYCLENCQWLDSDSHKIKHKNVETYYIKSTNRLKRRISQLKAALVSNSIRIPDPI